MPYRLDKAYSYKPFRHLSFLNTLVTSTRIDMSCAHAPWVCTGYWRNSEGSVWPNPVRLSTQHVKLAYLRPI